MSTSDESGERERRPTLASRVAWSTDPAGFAYVPGRVLVRGDAAARHLDLVTGSVHERIPLGGREGAAAATWTRIEGVKDPLAVVALLRADGFDAGPDHVFFAHNCDECHGPHPALTFDALAADPFRANPFRANPFRANPFRANPFRANPFRANEAQTSSALPALDRSFGARSLAGPGSHPRITVLDTGIAAGAQLPALVNDPRISGPADLPDAMLTAAGTPFGPDGWLDPVAGHGTFIAGLIEQLAPGCEVRVESVISPLGDARESDVLEAIHAVTAAAEPPDMLSLSFGGAALAQAPALRSAIAAAQLAGIVVVASAGNEGSCEPQYPAAYDGVIAVGAVGPDGPPPWTNYGDWVDACAPGVDVVSAFFADFDGPAPLVNTADPDRFEGWATWSGTSFSAPVVVAALAREMVLGNCTAAEAVTRVVHAPYALRIRCLGTVVSA